MAQKFPKNVPESGVALQTKPDVIESKQDHRRTELAAPTAVLPLRLFLAISFLAAGWDKLSDPEFFNSSSGGYIGNQLAGYAHSSPLGSFLNTVAVPNATLFGALVLVGELAIGLGTLVGLFSRTAAFFGLVLSLTLWLTASWQVSPFFLGSDLPYAIGWLILLIAGAHPIWSLDGQWHISKLQKTKNPLLTKRPNTVNAVVASSVANPISPTSNNVVARRRFITVAGATIFTGVVTAFAWTKTLADKQEQNNGNGTSQATNNSTTNTVSSNVENTPTVASNTALAPEATSTPVILSPNPVNNPASTATSVSTTTTTAVPATTRAVATATPTLAAIKGTVLTKLSSIGVGDAQKFTTPDTQEPAILIHETDGSVKAFSTICTHEGCEVSYIKSAQVLACPCHGAQFSATTGGVLRRPANRPLASFPVKVDGNGNVVYVQG